MLTMLKAMWLLLPAEIAVDKWQFHEPQIVLILKALKQEIKTVVRIIYSDITSVLLFSRTLTKTCLVVFPDAFYECLISLSPLMS